MSRYSGIDRESLQCSCAWGGPRQRRNFFPERHLGLVPPVESEDIGGAVELAADKMSEYLDIEALWKLAAASPHIDWPQPAAAGKGLARWCGQDWYNQGFGFSVLLSGKPRSDGGKRGASSVGYPALMNAPLPEIDALYIGGGFPETHWRGFVPMRFFSVRSNPLSRLACRSMRNAAA